MIDTRAGRYIRSISGLKGVTGALVHEPTGLLFASNRGVGEKHLLLWIEYRESFRVQEDHVAMLDVGDRRPVEDIVWTAEGYRDVYAASGLAVLETHLPLGMASEPWSWVSETTVPPWTIYVLGSASE